METSTATPAAPSSSTDSATASSAPATPAPASAPAPAAPASAPSTVSEPTTGATPADAATGSGPAAPDADLGKLLSGLTPEQILELDPRLNGKIGEIAQKRAERVARTIAADIARAEVARQKAEEVQRAEVERLRELRRTDPYAYAAEDERRDVEAEQRAVQQTRENALIKSAWADFDAIIHAHHATLPPEVQQALSGKEYAGGAREARMAYLAEAAQLVAEHKANAVLKTEVDKQLAKRSTEQEQALRSKLLAEINGGEASQPTTSGTGVPAPSDAVTPDEWDANKGRRDWRVANKARINQALSKGVPLRP